MKLIQLIRKSRLPMPERQHVIEHNGKFLGRVDLAYPAAKVAIEVDSSTFHLGMAEWHADLARGCLLTSAGWLVLHFTNEDLKKPAWVIECIGNTLSERMG